jgi:hypothetical protein
MICQHCGTELEANGLQSFGRTLDENYCCLCWFDVDTRLTNLEQADFFYDEGLHSPYMNSLEDDGYHITGKDQPNEIMAWLKKTVAACDEEIASLESEIEGVKRKRTRLDEKRFEMEQWLPDWEAKQKEDIPEWKRPIEASLEKVTP